MSRRTFPVVGLADHYYAMSNILSAARREETVP